MKEIPRPKGKGPRSKAPSLHNLRQGAPPPTSQGRMFEKRQQQQQMPSTSRPDIYSVAEGREDAPGLEETDKSSHYDEEYHEATTIPRETSQVIQVARYVSPEDMVPAERAATPVRPPVAFAPPPLTTPQRQQPATPSRPSPQQWKAQTPSPAYPQRPSPAQWSAQSTPPAAAYPQRPSPAQWSAQSLPPVSRAPVTTLKSPPQPTIHIKGTKGESEL
jgi:hypothetical protein